MATDGMGGTDGAIKVDSDQTREEQPTERLRFVERHVDFAGTIRPVRILQQRWIIIHHDCRGRDAHLSYEWRDVPLELEG